MEANQAWAKSAPVLVLGIVNLRFSKNSQDNRAAVHDLGLAAGNLLAEATNRGLSVHQMIGILPAKARETYQIPAHCEPWTAMAIGNKADPATLAEAPEGARPRAPATKAAEQVRVLRPMGTGILPHLEIRVVMGHRKHAARWRKRRRSGRSRQ